FDDPRDVVGLEERIRIAQQHELATRGRDALIHCGSKSAIVRIPNRRLFRAAVGRTVIDDDQLDVGPALLTDCGEAAREMLRAVPGHEDDGSESSHRPNAFFATFAYARTDGQRPLPFAKPATDAAQRSSMPVMIIQRSASDSPGVNHFCA